MWIVSHYLLGPIRRFQGRRVQSGAVIHFFLVFSHYDLMIWKEEIPYLKRKREQKKKKQEFLLKIKGQMSLQIPTD